MAKGKYQQWLEPDGLLKLEAWARNGLTDEQIAKNMGVVTKTLYEWKKQHSNICEALKKGKEVVDIQVENALFKRAIGYEYDEVTYEYGQETKRVTKQVAPDVTAQIFWLKNRKPEHWRDKKDIEVSDQAERKDMTDEEIQEKIKTLKSKIGFDASD